MTNRKIALVTGGNRGIGFEVCKQLAQKGFQVLLGCRDPHRGEKAVQELKALHLEVELVAVDTSDPTSIDAAFLSIQNQWGRLDVLVNNAGIFIDTRDGNSALETTVATLEETFRTNTVGPFLLCQKFIPLMVRNGGGRVINLSSGMGQLSEMQGGYPSYRISKAGINAVTKIFAAEAKHPNVFVNSVCPGWVKTEMGGETAPRTVDKGAETIVWLASDPTVKTTGSFFRDKTEIPW